MSLSQGYQGGQGSGHTAVEERMHKLDAFFRLPQMLRAALLSFEMERFPADLNSPRWYKCINDVNIPDIYESVQFLNLKGSSIDCESWVNCFYSNNLPGVFWDKQQFKGSDWFLDKSMADLELTPRGADLTSGFSESHIIPFLFSTNKPHLRPGEIFSSYKDWWW